MRTSNQTSRISRSLPLSSHLHPKIPPSSRLRDCLVKLISPYKGPNQDISKRHTFHSRALCCRATGRYNFFHRPRAWSKNTAHTQCRASANFCRLVDSLYRWSTPVVVYEYHRKTCHTIRPIHSSSSIEVPPLSNACRLRTISLDSTFLVRVQCVPVW